MGRRPSRMNRSKVKSSWWLSACHVFSSDNIIPFSKLCGWISTLLLVKALLKNFYFISVRFYCVIDGNYMKAISLPDSLCGLCERWDSGIKPTCFASSQRVCGVGVCFSPWTHMHSNIFVCVSGHESRHECEIDLRHRELSVDYLPRERWSGHPHVSQRQRVQTKLEIHVTLIPYHCFGIRAGYR